MPGGVFFLTIVAHRREPIFGDPENVARLREALKGVKRDRPFSILGAVVLPDHVHLLGSLPRGDSDFSTRVGRMKVLFTRSLGRDPGPSPVPRSSRRKPRESEIWQRRFWEHRVAGEDDLQACLDYIHHNPVKHGLVT